MSDEPSEGGAIALWEEPDHPTPTDVQPRSRRRSAKPEPPRCKNSDGSPGPTAQEILAAWITWQDEVTGGVRLPRNTLDRIGKHVRELVESDYGENVIKFALVAWLFRLWEDASTSPNALSGIAYQLAIKDSPMVAQVKAQIAQGHPALVAVQGRKPTDSSASRRAATSAAIQTYRRGGGV